MGMSRLSHAAAARVFNGEGPQRQVSLDQARALIVEQVCAHRDSHPLRRELADLLARPEPQPGRMLAQPVAADRDWPPFRRAMRDGYALRAADAAAGRLLPCVGQIPAGMRSHGTLAPGACCEIMTGAPMPDEADAVVMIEHTRRITDAIHFDRPVTSGDNIAPRGSDTAAGTLIAQPGQRLNAAAIAVLAQAGCTRPEVFAAPRIAILTTGDELVAADAVPAYGQIRNSNGPMLAALARQAGALVAHQEHVPDNAATFARTLTRAATAADLVVCSGGASVGAHDLIAPTLAEVGAEVWFDAVAMRPGRPQWFARLPDGTLFFGLPGNPLSAWLGFTLLAQPALALLAGLDAQRLPPPFLPARMGFAWQGKPLALTLFRPVRLQGREVQPLPFHGSADLAAAAAADAWLVVPPGTETLAAGTPVEVLPA